MTPPDKPFAQAVDEGVAATDADTWQAAGYSGTGVKVAIIDLGFQGYQVTARYCPSGVRSSPTTAAEGATAGSSVAVNTNHGTAVAEIVHQMAPGAQLYLMCIDTELDLKLAEQDAIADGVKIVNHSIGWFNTSRGDGSGGGNTPDATVADARAHGILWVNAAGNYASQHWSGPFTPSGTSGDVHSYGIVGNLDQVVIQSGEQGCAFLKWDEWPLTSDDFDLYLVRMSDNQIVDASLADQSSGLAPPTEELCYTNTGATQAFGLGIVRFSAATNPRLDLFYVGSSSLQLGFADGSIAEPASSPAALAVGADCWQNGTQESFSSVGPTIDGRVKPDLTAPDGVSTSTYGSAGATCGQSGFLGTSASSPQVAGAAAVLLDRGPASARPHSKAHSRRRRLGSAVLSVSPTLPWEAAAFGLARRTRRWARSRSGSSSGIYVVSPDGTGLARVNPTGFGAVAWSPDGSKIAFGSGAGIATVDPHGGHLTPVVATGHLPATRPAERRSRTRPARRSSWRTRPAPTP